MDACTVKSDLSAATDTGFMAVVKEKKKGKYQGHLVLRYLQI